MGGFKAQLDILEFFLEFRQQLGDDAEHQGFRYADFELSSRSVGGGRDALRFFNRLQYFISRRQKFLAKGS